MWDALKTKEVPSWSWQKYPETIKNKHSLSIINIVKLRGKYTLKLRPCRSKMWLWILGSWELESRLNYSEYMNTWSSQGSNYSWYFYNHECFCTNTTIIHKKKPVQIVCFESPLYRFSFQYTSKCKKSTRILHFSIYRLFIHMIIGVSGSIIPFYLQFNGFLYIGLS